MNAEVIAIGDELTSGQRLDTNSQWISLRLGEAGIRVLFHTTVGDEQDANARVFREAIQRAEIVVCTGGLGPTADDLTRQALSEATGRELRLDESALEHVRSLFARRKRGMPQRNRVQAMFPEGSRVIPNPHGTAPGIDLEIVRPGRSPCRVFALPGVPAEMRQMWAQTVSPALAQMQGDQRRVIRHRRIKCFGTGESDLEQMLPDLIRRGQVPTVGITASKTTLTLRITAIAESEAACEAQMAPTIATIHDCLGNLVFGDEDDELQDAVVRLLDSHGETVATAEIGSGGTLASWLSEADQSHRVYAGGLIVRAAADVQFASHDGQAMHELVEPADADRLRDLVDRQFKRNQSWQDVVKNYAEQLRALYGVDHGLAVGPFPESDSTTATPGSVCVGLATQSRTKAVSFPFTGHPAALKHRAIKQTLNYLRLSLLKRQMPEDG